MRIRYKVVGVDGDRLISTNAEGELQATYVVERWTTAPIGGLFVFKELHQAKAFVGTGRKRIFEARVDGRVPLPGAKLNKIRWLLDGIKAWRKPKRRWDRVWPAGSEAYRLVRLMREVPK